LVEQGQLIGGAIAATLVATSVSLPAPVMIPLEMSAGMAGGSVASVAGVLKAYVGAHEVITRP
jgi:simple sugar transport system permease protein